MKYSREPILFTKFDLFISAGMKYFASCFFLNSDLFIKQEAFILLPNRVSLTCNAISETCVLQIKCTIYHDYIRVSLINR